MARFVQQSSVGTVTGTSVALSFSPNTTLNNGIVVLIVTDGALAEILAPTDNFGNTYTLAADKTNASALSCSVWYTANSGSGIHTVTCNFNSSQTATCVAVEVLDGATLDTSASAAVNSDTPNPGSLTTAVANEIVFALLRSSGTISATPAGYTTISEDDSPAKDFRYQEFSVPTATDPTWTLASSAPHAVLSVAFRESNNYTAHSYPPPIVRTVRDRRMPYQLWDKRVSAFPPPPPTPPTYQPQPLPIRLAPVMYGMPGLRWPIVVSGTHPAPVTIGPFIQPKPVTLHPLHPANLQGKGRYFHFPTDTTRPEDIAGVGAKLPLLARVPREANVERLRRTIDQLITIVNSLIRDGTLVQDEARDWHLDSGGIDEP